MATTIVATTGIANMVLSIIPIPIAIKLNVLALSEEARASARRPLVMWLRV